MSGAAAKFQAKYHTHTLMEGRRKDHCLDDEYLNPTLLSLCLSLSFMIPSPSHHQIFFAFIFTPIQIRHCKKSLKTELKVAAHKQLAAGFHDHKMMMCKTKYFHKDKKSQCKFHQLSLPLSKEQKKPDVVTTVDDDVVCCSRRWWCTHSVSSSKLQTADRKESQ
jgi:hypothetical protein